MRIETLVATGGKEEEAFTQKVFYPFGTAVVGNKFHFTIFYHHRYLGFELEPTDILNGFFFENVRSTKNEKTSSDEFHQSETK